MIKSGKVFGVKNRLVMNSEFVGSSDNRWHQVKELGLHDFYHLPEYVELDAKLIHGVPKCWVASSKNCDVWIPLIERKIPEQLSKGKEYYDLTSPYGFSGILFSNPVLPDEMNQIIEQFKNDAAKHNYITSFLRMNPLINPFIWQQNDYIEQIYHGYTITVPLEKKYEKIRNGYSSNHRQDIRKLKNKGFRFLLDDWSYYNDFLVIYEQSMDRLEASEYYYFSKEYFNRLFDILRDRIHLAIVTDKNKKAVAGGLFTDFNGVIQSHLGATRTSYLREAPSKLVFNGIIEWAADTGRKWLHMGGGLNSKEDSLYRFKKGFSSTKNQFLTLRIIHDKQRYNNLNYIALRESGLEKFENPNYFPLYRQIKQYK